jgi:hypothetical protein
MILIALMMITVSSTGNLFDHSLTCLGFLLAYAETGDVNRSSPVTDVPLSCQLTFARLTDPVTVQGSTSNKVYNRKSLLDRMTGGPMCVAGSPWEKLSTEQLVSDFTTKMLLLCHPYTDDIVVIPALTFKPNKDETWEYEWSQLARHVQTDASCLNVIPPLSLRRAKIPAIAMDANRLACVYLGPEPCSVNTVTFLSPAERKSKAVNPDLLAKTLGSSAAAVIDDRPPREAIIVCLDTSSSMSRASFGKEAEADAEPEPDPVFSIQELHQELQKLRNDPYINIYKRFARKRPQSLWMSSVIRELAEANPIRKQLCNQQRKMVEELLLQGDVRIV